MAADSHAHAGRQVGVEVQPFKEHAGATHDFTFGYCNWARAAGAQHLVWHARSASQARLLHGACLHFFYRPHPAWRQCGCALWSDNRHGKADSLSPQGSSSVRAPGAVYWALSSVFQIRSHCTTSCVGLRGRLGAVRAVHPQARLGSAWGRLLSASSAPCCSRPLRVRQGCSGPQVVPADFPGSAGAGDFKHHHVRLGADAGPLLDAAAALFRAGPARPGAGQCVYGNEPLF